jgi:hypothetical protein
MLILKLLRYFTAAILAIVDDRMRVLGVLFLKTSIRSSLNSDRRKLLLRS